MKLFKSENLIIYSIAFILSACAAMYLNFGLSFIFGDALVRSFHAYQVFFGYDPKLSAIGFVWPPLQTLLQLPLTLVKPLNTYGIAGNLLSSIFFGLTIVYLNKIAIFFQVKKVFRYILLFLFATNPLIFFYGINGMSEIIGICFMIMTLYYFLRYVDSKNILFLIASCLSLAFAIMTRWEMAVLLGVLLPLIVYLPFVHKAFSHKESESSTIIFLLPIIAALAVWAIISWMITGSPFPGVVQIDNNLGDGSAQIHASEGVGQLLLEALKKLLLLSPFMPVIAIASFLTVKSHARINLFAILGFGLVLSASQALLFSLGKTVGELRYFIYIIPVTYVLIYFLVMNVQKRFGPKIRLFAYLVGFLCMAISSFTTYQAMASNQYNNQEHLFIHAVKNGHNNTTYYNYEDDAKIAKYLGDSMQNRSILADDSVAFSIIYLSQKSGMFIQTIDRDFEAALTNPAEYDISYILVSRPHAKAPEDLINKKYPTLFESGMNSFTLEKDFGDWKLYRILRPNEVIVNHIEDTTTSACNYSVKSGDSLWTIAQTRLGSGLRYMDIIELNEGVTENSSSIYPDQNIIVPCNKTARDIKE